MANKDVAKAIRDATMAAHIRSMDPKDRNFITDAAYVNAVAGVPASIGAMIGLGLRKLFRKK